MRLLLAFLAAAIVGLLSTDAARASTMEVRYQLGGTLGLQLGTTFVPLGPGGGLLKIAYPTSATGPISSMGNGFAPQPGAVRLVSAQFGAEFTNLVSHFPNSMAVAAQHFSLRFELASALGTLRSMGTLFFPLLEAAGGGMLTCFGAPPHCDAATASIPQTLVIDPFSFSWNAPNHLSGGALRAAALVPKTIPLDPSGIEVLQLVTATEIDRHLVPEPASFSLLGCGLVALLVARRARGIRRA